MDVGVFEICSTIICTGLASSGLWSYLSIKQSKHDVKAEMLIGLGHDRIRNLGLEYINRGYITTDELDNINYLWRPYTKLGGNGTAEQIMDKVKKLDIRN